ncbi:AAA family ATPase [Saccharopolyspora sp. K220]|uniref:AAA family ATPase n=1 Tax=Saccharopolyspora soli TaxID=2926618 RepID=UPI001F5A42DE|nr:AAA family ATPase [Saccharopolyspora soli]MCI2422523.1 AAA family ATPase [Saccharopolyspora soli]
MRAGEEAAGPEFVGRVLHESERARITRLFLAGRTVVRKELRGPDAPQRRRHELAMLERLRGVPGTAQLVEAPQYAESIVVADVGGTTLAELAKPLSPDALIELGLELAQAVAEMHHRGVMHRNITPGNIMLSRDGGPCLINFTLASSFAEIRPEFTHHSKIVGTLAYLAPEQTGRIARVVDQRADLYALGATLYELATGAPPFGSGDPLRLTRDHLTRVPVPPAEVTPAVPAPLSEIIMHLLEKEPDNRYQTAKGVVHDLRQLRDTRTDPEAGPVRVGEHDVPLRLLPPSRLVGRDAEVGELRAAFEDALAGRRRGVLIGGAPGVGKTALVDELRPVVTGSDGWFVAGKFDPHQRDLAFDGLYQAMRALGRLLLAEPEDELAVVRERILGALGSNAGLATAVVPEFAALLAVPPDPGDALTAQARVQRSGLEILRAVASRKRPVVLFVDDLQWAGRTPLGAVDLLLGDEPVEGLLLVGAYRAGEVDAGHPLAEPLSRWREQGLVRHVWLDNLPEPGLAAVVEEMLHVDRAVAAGLVEVINQHTLGNPYETVELLNALRRDGLLSVTTAGWSWDPAAVRAHLGGSEIAALLAARVEAMPAPSRQLLEAMACLGGRAELSVLQTATGESAGEVEQRLAPVVDEGVLVVEPWAYQAVRFRHDRIREVILRGLDPQRRGALQLAMARRLASVPELFAVAAEQYLPVASAVDDAAERRVVVALLRRAADQASLTGEHVLVDALLAAALRLIDPSDTDTLIQVHADRHTALYSLGRLEEADEEYRVIARLCTSAAQRVDATCVQVRSLTHRNRSAEAIELGLESLRECGITVPAADRLPAELDRQFDHLHRWLDHTDAADDLARPDLTDPTLLATSRLINVVLSAAYFVADSAMVGWLSLEAIQIWLEHGPSPTLVGPVSHIGLASVALRDDYLAGYRAMRRVLPLGEARGWEPEISHARFVFALGAWASAPLEDAIQAFRRARRGLIAGADPANASYTYITSMPLLVDCAPSLESLLAEVEAGLAFARHIGNEQTVQRLDGYRWLAHALRGDTPAGAGDVFPFDRYADNPAARLYAHISWAIAAVVFDDPVSLARHSSAAMPLLPTAVGLYSTAVARLLRGLAVAGQARTAVGDERAAALSELDELIRWLAARAAEAPDNFLYLLRLLEAERAWAVGKFRAAVVAFDAARRAAAACQRPWHRAVIAERAARFYLAHGVEHAGHHLLAQARAEYAAWGATAKVDQLDWAHPTLRPEAVAAAGPGGDQPADQRDAVTTGTLDLLGILSASQALSSETSVERLQARLVEVLSAIAGATGVQLLLWSSDQHGWLLPGSADSGNAQIAGPGHEHAVPISVLRYVQRTGGPLVVDDATRDDRFARDPYFADLDCCSLLALSILGRGSPRAVLLLENRLIRGAFSSERLDAVKLIAGQLAVSLDNAQLYDELTASRARIVAAADQTRRRIERDLHDGAQQRLISLAMQARAMQATLPPEARELTEGLASLAAEATKAQGELRELARGIHPAVLAESGLRPAIKALARRCSVPVQLAALTDQRLPEQIEIAAYYLVAEALANAVKHAHASTITIASEVADDVLRVCVRDDGRGGADPGGSGLVGLKDRVEALGGWFSVRSAPGAGTALRAEFPLNRVNPG